MNNFHTQHQVTRSVKCKNFPHSRNKKETSKSLESLKRLLKKKNSPVKIHPHMFHTFVCVCDHPLKRAESKKKVDLKLLRTMGTKNPSFLSVTTHIFWGEHFAWFWDLKGSHSQNQLLIQPFSYWILLSAPVSQNWWFSGEKKTHFPKFPEKSLGNHHY